MNDNPNPSPCLNCGNTWGQCNTRMARYGKACCSFCAYTVAHDQDAAPGEPAATACPTCGAIS